VLFRSAQAFYKSRGACQPVSQYDGTGDFFAAEQTPSSDWVQFQPELKKVTDRLGVAYLNGSDGSRVLDGLRLLPENKACQEETADGATVSTPPPAGAGSVRCLPSNMTALDASYFTDGTCRTSVAAMLACNPPDLVRGYAPEIPIDAAVPICRPSAGIAPAPLFRPVLVPSSAVYVGYGQADGGMSCTPTPYGGFQYYAAGAPVPMEEFPVVTLGPKGSGRFQPIVTSSEGRTLYTHANLLYDTETASVCQPEQLPGDGRTICIPDSVAVTGPSDYSGPFADPACTKHLVGFEPDCGQPVPVAVQVLLPNGSCGAVTFRQIVGVHAAPTYVFEQSGPPDLQGLCGPAPPGSSVAYDIGGEVDPASLFPLLVPGDL